jgi:hypothetical protein
MRRSILPGFTAMVAMIAGGSGAQATLSVASITVKGGVFQGSNDPPYTSQLAVSLSGIIEPASSTSPTSITFGGLEGVNLSSLASVTIVNEYNAPGVSWSDQIQVTHPATTNYLTCPSLASSYDVSSVTWNYTGTSSITGTNLLLGIFEVTTAPAYLNHLPAGYPSFVTSADLSYTLNGISSTTSDSGIPLTLQIGGLSLVPEPSTAIAVLWAVVGSLPLAWFARRRGLRRPRAA